jgi:Sulfotransferase family
VRPDDRKFFFIHVMKTAGTTLRKHIMANFEEDEFYPCPRLDANMLKANIELDYLTGLPASRRARIRAYSGHFPFVAVELLGEEMTTITILRDPVERTLSFLRDRKATHHPDGGVSLEEIYEDPFLFLALIRNHQAKLFALTVDDELGSYMRALDIDSDRLELAKRNLESVDVVGTQDRFEDLLSELELRFGWRRGSVGRMFAGKETPGDAPASFRRRIADDNQADMEFFEHAVRLCERRRATLAR